MTMTRTDSLPATAPGLARYLIVDGAQEGIWAMLYRHLDQPAIEPLYLETRHAPAMLASPLLLPVPDDNALWQRAGDWRSKGVLVDTLAPLDQLAGHLRSLISVTLPSSQLAYCRFYAPRWLRPLVAAMTVAEARVFSGPVQSWHLSGPQHDWLSVRPGGPTQARTPAEEGWFHLRPDHIAALSQPDSAGVNAAEEGAEAR